MMTAGRTQPPGAALSLSPPPGQAPPPRLRPCATRRGRLPRPASLLISPARPLARGGGTPEPCAQCALAGQVLGHPPAVPLLCRGQRGRRRFREAGVGRGLCLQLGTFKGQIHVICPSKQWEHHVSAACGTLYL